MKTLIFWHVTRTTPSDEIIQEVYREISPYNDIALIACYETFRGEYWRVVGDGSVYSHCTRLWSLPNHYTCSIKIKPRDLEWVEKSIGKGIDEIIGKNRESLWLHLQHRD